MGAKAIKMSEKYHRVIGVIGGGQSHKAIKMSKGSPSYLMTLMSKLDQISKTYFTLVIHTVKSYMFWVVTGHL